MIAAEDTSIGWGGKELWGLRGHLERIRRRGAENKSTCHGDYGGGTGGKQQRFAVAPPCPQQDGVSIAHMQLT